MELPASWHMVPMGLGLVLIGADGRLGCELCEPRACALAEQPVAMTAGGSPPPRLPPCSWVGWHTTSCTRKGSTLTDVIMKCVRDFI